MPLIVPAVTQPPQDRPPDAAAATDADAVAFRSTSNSSAMIVSIPAGARMRPAHQLACAQHKLAGRDVGAPDPLLNSTAVERRLRRAVQRGKITGVSHILGRSGELQGFPLMLIHACHGRASIRHSGCEGCPRHLV